MTDKICGVWFEDIDGVWKTCILLQHSSRGHVGKDESELIKEDWDLEFDTSEIDIESKYEYDY